MKRIITYLYEYQNGVRRGSAGVFKLDLLGEECRIQLNLQGSVPVEEQGKVYFAVKNGEGDLTEVPMGETSRYRGAGGGNWVVRQNGICGSPYSFDDVHGMAVRYPSGRYLASCWEEEADERFLRGDFEEEKQTEEADENSGNAEIPEMFRELKDVKNIEDIENIEDTESLENTENIENIEDTESLEDTENIENIEDTESLEDTENIENIENPKVIENNPEAAGVWKSDENSEIKKETKTDQDSGKLHAEELSNTAPKETLQRMDISDIRSLPKKNWHLCSNSFLIHGFFSYHYLVRKDVEENGLIKSYLGVPGIYARAERAMAMLFGFPEFEEERRVSENSVMKEQAGKDNGANPKESRIPEGSFGYWLCQLEM